MCSGFATRIASSRACPSLVRDRSPTPYMVWGPFVTWRSELAKDVLEAPLVRGGRWYKWWCAKPMSKWWWTIHVYPCFASLQWVNGVCKWGHTDPKPLFFRGIIGWSPGFGQWTVAAWQDLQTCDTCCFSRRHWQVFCWLDALLDCSPFASMKQKNRIPQPVDFPLGKYKKKQLTHSYQSPLITIITSNPHKIPQIIPQIPILLRLSQQRALGGDGFHPNPAANPRVWAAARVQHPLGLCPDAAARAIDVASSWVGTLSPGFSLFSMCFVVDYGIMKWSQRDELVVWRTVVCKNCDHTCFSSEQTWVRMVMKLLNSTATGFVEDPSSKGSFQLFCYVCTS